MCPEIDYDLYGREFARSYFLENYWKAASVFHQEKQNRVRYIVDAGCGSGAASIAYLTTLNATLTSPAHVDLILVDRSDEQLRLAKQMLDRVMPCLHNLNVHSSYTRSKIEDWLPTEDSADIVLLGHVLSENQGDQATDRILEKAFGAVSSRGRIFVLERPDDSIWKFIGDSIGNSALPSTYRETKFQTDEVIIPNYHQAARKHELRCRYVSIACPSHKHSARAVRLYFNAWRQQSTELIEDLFAQDGEYYEKPYEKPYRGHREITDYWRENVLEQKDIQLRIIRVALEDDTSFAEWEARFLRSGEHVHLKGALILSLHPDDHRVTSLREYYRREGAEEKRTLRAFLMHLVRTLSLRRKHTDVSTVRPEAHPKA
ncbi:MAG: nuclear transport factor 2 family protein [Thaumarchaeota archaeon]|nr:nuclear transport factor 2 family protein [Nitrososphaerota archaeon]